MDSLEYGNVQYIQDSVMKVIIKIRVVAQYKYGHQIVLHWTPAVAKDISIFSGQNWILLLMAHGQRPIKVVH